MQSIQTKYLPATNKGGSRIKAYCERGSITIDYPHNASGGIEGAHVCAIRALVAKFVKEDEKAGSYATRPQDNPWAKPFLVGGLKSGFVAVFCPGYEKTKLLEFETQADADSFSKCVVEIRATDGTPSSLRMGRLASVLRNAKGGEK